MYNDFRLINQTHGGNKNDILKLFRNQPLNTL